MDAGTPMITLRSVGLMLGARPILKDVSLDVRPGETKVILGGSGSGKTTILRLILGLYRPDQGSIFVGGQEITHLGERDLSEIRQRMAMVFQNAALFDSLTVRENVGYRLWERDLLSDEQIDLAVIESLRFVGLEDTVDKMPAELSGGMRKRVGIARALASGATALLYDEPTAGLDPINTCMVGRLIQRLKTKGVTQIVVTHDLDTAYRVADRIVMIASGRILFDGTPDELRRSAVPAIREFLDPGSMPPDWRLLPKPDIVDEPAG
ncbi:MAG: ATP-binding cassette domain-containing protein [Nitrospirae bacterium]|nr:MAG: ATP-binding cassette domain-containing protein [Nitrospirota bacterium]